MDRGERASETRRAPGSRDAARFRPAPVPPPRTAGELAAAGDAHPAPLPARDVPRGRDARRSARARSAPGRLGDARRTRRADLPGGRARRRRGNDLQRDLRAPHGGASLPRPVSRLRMDPGPHRRPDRPGGRRDRGGRTHRHGRGVVLGPLPVGHPRPALRPHHGTPRGQTARRGGRALLRRVGSRPLALRTRAAARSRTGDRIHPRSPPRRHLLRHPHLPAAHRAQLARFGTHIRRTGHPGHAAQDGRDAGNGEHPPHRIPDEPAGRRRRIRNGSRRHRDDPPQPPEGGSGATARPTRARPRRGAGTLFADAAGQGGHRRGRTGLLPRTARRRRRRRTHPLRRRGGARDRDPGRTPRRRALPRRARFRRSFRTPRRSLLDLGARAGRRPRRLPAGERRSAAVPGHRRLPGRDRGRRTAGAVGHSHFAAGGPRNHGPHGGDVPGSDDLPRGPQLSRAAHLGDGPDAGDPGEPPVAAQGRPAEADHRVHGAPARERGVLHFACAADGGTVAHRPGTPEEVGPGECGDPPDDEPGRRATRVGHAPGDPGTHPPRRLLGFARHGRHFRRRRPDADLPGGRGAAAALADVAPGHRAEPARVSLAPTRATVQRVQRPGAGRPEDRTQLGFQQGLVHARFRPGGRPGTAPPPGGGARDPRLHHERHPIGRERPGDERTHLREVPPLRNGLRPGGLPDGSPQRREHPDAHQGPPGRFTRAELQLRPEDHDLGRRHRSPGRTGARRLDGTRGLRRTRLGRGDPAVPARR